MRRFADSLRQRARGSSPAAGDDGDSGEARPDPTEILRAHLRSGGFTGSDGLDDYDGDFSVEASSPKPGSEPDHGPVAGAGESAHGEEASTSREPSREEEKAVFPPPRPETARAVPCEMIRSRGRTLIVGAEEADLRAQAGRLSGELDCFLLLVGTKEESPRLDWSGGRACLVCSGARIRGSFGAFRIEVPASGEMLHAFEVVFGEQKRFDLVLDRTLEGVFAASRPPMGYFWASASEALEAALEELPRLRGRFEKQHFLRLAPEACAHGHAGMRGCSRCIEACPYGALRVGKQAPEVDHFLCQGCLLCVSACPTGALEPLLFGREELLARMEEAMAAPGASSAAPVLLVHHEESPPGEALKRAGNRMPVIPVPVEATGLMGAECLLAALALGAAGVVVQEEDPATKVLQDQLRWARAILEALGRSPQRIQFAARDLCPELPSASQAADVSPAEVFSGRDKRAVLSRAVRLLAREEALASEPREMPREACFGAVEIRSESCTLCMACAGACPTRAIKPGGEERPGLRFTESRCVQCGLCARVCPEQALFLSPRLSPERLATETQVWLHWEDPVLCRVCGRPFASAGMLEKIRSTLRHRRGEEEPEWLTMCGDCRVRTLFREPEDGP